MCRKLAQDDKNDLIAFLRSARKSFQSFARPLPSRPARIAHASEVGCRRRERASLRKRASSLRNPESAGRGSALNASRAHGSIRQGQAALGPRPLRLAHHLHLEDRPELVNSPLIRSSNSSSVAPSLRGCYRIPPPKPPSHQSLL